MAACAVIGVGASAGGVDALRRLCSALPADAPFALVVVQHLDPSTPSRLADILAASTSLRVKRAEEGAIAEPGSVLVVPEGVEARFEADALKFSPRHPGCYTAIDDFLSSLANDSRRGACAVLLSGTGSDGTHGLAEIRNSGGITMVQAPDTAEHPEMPLSAINAGAADFVGSPEAIAEELLATVSHPRFALDKAGGKRGKADESKQLARVLSAVRNASGMDFSGYKMTTVARRVNRRMMLRGVDTLDSYLRLLADDASEAQAFADDMLINVTEFFRDPEVFEVLRTKLFPSLLAEKPAGEPLRIWVAGCSTGEEVYSVLITALEAIEEAGESRSVSVFGSDASESAVRRARAGQYPEGACARVAPDRLARYFVRTERGYEVDRALRDMCVFARQDITRDTPFSRLDMVTLRNVLIYMDSELQKRVLSVAHFALSPGGYLVLGTSESPEAAARLFKGYDKAHHIYRRSAVTPQLPFDVASVPTVDIGALSSPSRLGSAGQEKDVRSDANELALLLYAPARVVVDESGHVLHFFGDTSPYLEHPEGRATLELLELVAAGLALEVKEALDVSAATAGHVTREALFGSGAHKRRVAVDVTPLSSAGGRTRRLVAFRELPAEQPQPGGVANDDLAALYEAREDRFRSELAALRGRVRAVSEEKDQANQGLRVANEEARSSNEELRSINEELETAKEELQSANEELTTVNDELRLSNQDLVFANSDLRNFMESTGIPVLMLDSDLHVRRFTPQATEVVRISAKDEQRPLSHLRFKVDVTDLEELALRVMSTQTMLTREVRSDDGRWYSMQLRPYLSSDGTIDGVVLAFIDIDELRKSMERITRRSELSRALNTIDVAMSATLDFDAMATAAITESVRALRLDAGAVLMRDGDDWVIRKQVGMPGSDIGTALPASQAAIANRTLESGGVVLVSDLVNEEALDAGFARERGLRSAVSIPLVVRGAVVGCILIFSRSAPLDLDPAEADFITQLGASVSLAVENARLIESERDAARRAQTLNAINEIINSALTSDELIERLVGEVSVVAGAEKSLAIRVEGDIYRVIAVRKVRDGIVGVPRPADFFPGFALAASEKHALLIGDTWADDRTNKDFVVPYDVRAFQLLPLVVDGETHAVLALGWSEPRTFSSEDQDACERFSVAMSVALSKALLYESEASARKRADRELARTTLLLAVARVLAEPADLEVRLGEVAELLGGSLEHDRVVISTLEPRDLVLRTVAQAGGADVTGRAVPLSDLSEVVREAITGKKPVITDYEAAGIESLSGIVPDRQYRFVMNVPIVFRERSLGVITVDQPGDRATFTDDEIAMVQGVASQVAAAVENTRLFEAEAERANRMASLREIAEIASSTLSLSEMGERFISAVGGLLGASHVLFNVKRSGGELLPIASSGFPPGLIEEYGAFVKGTEAAEVFASDTPRVHENLEESAFSERARQFLRAAGFRSNVGLPVKVGGHRLGTLSFGWDHPRHFTEESLQFLEAVAAQFALGVQNALLYEAEQARRQRIEVLRGITELSISSLEPGKAADAALGFIAEKLGVDAASLWTIDRTGQLLFPIGGHGFPPAFFEEFSAGIPLDPEGYLVARAYIEGKPAAVPGAPEGVPEPVRTVYEKHGVPLGALLALPLEGRHGRFGAVVLAWARPQVFDAAEITLWMTAVNTLAAGLEITRLYDSEHHAAMLDEALNAINESIHSTLQSHEILQGALDAGVSAIGCDSGTIEVREGAGWRVAFQCGFHADDTRRLLGPDEAPNASKAARTGTAFIIEDMADEEEANVGFVAEHGLKSVLAVPLVMRGEVRGCLLFYNHTARGVFDEFALDFGRKLAASVSLALQNADLVEAETRELERTRLLQQLATSLTASLTLADVGAAAEEVLRKLPEIHAGALHEFDVDRNVLTSFAHFGYPPEVEERVHEIEIDETSAVGKVVLHDLGIFTHEAEEIPERSVESAALMGIESMRWVEIPLRSAGELLGTLTLVFEGERSFETAELTLFRGIADTISAAVKNAQLVDDLDESRARAAAIVDSITDGFYALDREWRFLYANEEAARFLGVPADRSIVGKTIGEVLDDPERLAFQQHAFAPAMNEGKPVAMERHIPQTGIWTDMRIYPSVDGVVVYGRDISDRKAAEEAIRRQNGVLEAINHVLGLSLLCETEEELVSGSLAEAERITESAFGFIGEVDERGHLFDIALSDPGWSACAMYDKSGHRRAPGDFAPHGLYGKVLAERAGYYTNAPAEHPASIGTPKGHPPIESFIGVPLASEGGFFGMMALANKPGGYTDGDLRTLELLAPSIVESLLRKRAELTLSASRERADMLARLLDNSALPFAVATPGGDFLLANRAFERLTGYSADELRGISWVSNLTPPEFVEFEQEQLVELARTGGPVCYEKEYVRKNGTRVPIELLVNAAMGDDGEVDYFYSFITDLTERKQRELLDAALNRIGASMSSTLERDEIFARLFAGVSEALDTDAAAILTLDGGSSWHLRDACGVSMGPLAHLLEHTDRISMYDRDDTDRFSPLYIEDVAADPRVSALTDFGMKRLLAVPLLARGAVVGVLALGLSKPDKVFSAAQFNFAARLMPLATLALENADLYQRERLIADTLQDALITAPRPMENIETSYVYRAASEAANVGGDFFDVFELAGDKCCVVVGDVSGKGLEAARITSLMRDGIRAYALESSHPSEILSRLNRLVCRDTTPEQFATIFLGVIDRSTGTMRYCTAGHPTPLLISAEKVEYLVRTKSPILGAFEDADFHTHDTVLLPSERLLLYTDGVVEARHGANLLGEEGLLAIAAKMKRTPLKRLPERIVGKVLEFGGGELRDDTIVLALSLTGESSSAD